MDFSQIEGVITDMDGVLWRGEEPLPGLPLFFELVRARGIPFVLATNNSSKSPLDYVMKLARLGISDIQEGQIVTSGTATLGYLKAHYPPGTGVHVLGGDGLKQIIAAAGFPLLDEGVSVVVAGVDFQLTYERLRRAAQLIRRGADFIGTNADATFPMPDGLAPGAGSILAALQTATDRQPTVIGKPDAPMFEEALRVMGTLPERTLMIGDRLNTDVLGAQRVGLKTALVLTGVSTRADVTASIMQPDCVFDTLAELVAVWKLS